MKELYNVSLDKKLEKLIENKRPIFDAISNSILVDNLIAFNIKKADAERFLTDIFSHRIFSSIMINAESDVDEDNSTFFVIIELKKKKYLSEMLEIISKYSC